MRAALVDFFRDEGSIMIATEAGAEGINLQFCSLVVNFDLPWNPQRVEQRIGRCHRYGQQHDVVVVNFFNQKNEADQRVFQLLAEKFKLFEGVFGASDDVLGVIESGVDVEKRIADIYQRCRTPHMIQFAFDQLQADLSDQIDAALTRTRQQLLENFDDDVREKLRLRDEASRASLGRTERALLDVTRHELGPHAAWPDGATFDLLHNPYPHVAAPTGRYALPRHLPPTAHLYRLGHPLAAAVVAAAKARPLPPAEVRFSYAAYEGKISVLEPLIGASGWLALSRFAIETGTDAEDHLLIAASTDDGSPLDPAVAARLFALPGTVAGPAAVAAGSPQARARASLRAIAHAQSVDILADAAERAGAHFDDEMTKLDAWAADRRLSLRRGLKEQEEEITDLRKQARAAGTLPDKLAIQRRIKTAETRLDDAEAEMRAEARAIDRRKEELLDAAHARLQHQSTLTPLFTIRWRLT